MIPRVLFEINDLESEIIYTLWFQDRLGYISQINNFSLKEQEKNIRKIVTKEYNEQINAIKKAKKSFEEIWTKEINEQFFTEMSKLFEIDLSDLTYIAKISTIPFNPRFIQNQYFTQFYKTNKKNINTGISHELIHLIYFKKWSEVFPETDPKVYDGNTIEWHLSEILAIAIANENKILPIISKKKLGLYENDFYGEYVKKQIKGKNIFDYFTDIYTDLRNNHTPMEEILIELRNKALEHEKILKECYPTITSKSKWY